MKNGAEAVAPIRNQDTTIRYWMSSVLFSRRFPLRLASGPAGEETDGQLPGSAELTDGFDGIGKGGGIEDDMLLDARLRAHQRGKRVAVQPITVFNHLVY